MMLRWRCYEGLVAYKGGEEGIQDNRREMEMV